MNLFTAAYLARLEVWGLAAACLQGTLVMFSWIGWERATRHAAAATRHRLACLHFAALALSPALIVAVLHWTVSRTGIAIGAASGASRGASSGAVRQLDGGTQPMQTCAAVIVSR